MRKPRYIILSLVFTAIALLSLYGLCWSATYYVDATLGSDASADPTNIATPWKTIAKVNSVSFSAGDSILFKKGCTWRERLLVPSSGSDGSQITFGAYGSGAKPIINASSIYSGFAQRITYTGFTADGETVVLNKATTATQIIFFNQTGRIWVGQTAWTSDGNYTISAMEINVQSVAGSFNQNCVAEIYTLNGTSLNTLVGSSDALSISSSGVKKFTGMSASLSNGTAYALVVRRSDSSYSETSYPSVYLDNAGDSWSGNFATFNSDKTRGGNFSTYELGVKLYQGGASPYYTSYVEAPTTVYFDDAALEENTTSKASLTTGQWWKDTVNSRIYLYDNPSGHTVKGNDVWNASCSVAPKNVFSNGVRLTKNTTSKASLATGEWFDGTTKIYLYDDPSAATIEGSYYSMAINFNNKSYITVQDLEFTKSSGHNVWINTAAGRFDDLIVQRCTISYSHAHGLLAGQGGFATNGFGVSTGLHILNNDFSYNGIGSALEGGTGFAVNIAGNSPTDYIEDVLIQGNTCDGDNAGMKGDWFSNDIIFEKNYIKVVSTAFATDGGQDITWRYNIVDGALTEHTGYAFSLFRWEGVPGPPYGFALSGFNILNNTVYGYKKSISLYDDQTDTVVKNNIFYSNFADNITIWMEGGETRTGLDINYNLYYTGANAPVFTISTVDTYDFTEWKALGHDANSPNMADPLFVNAAGGDSRLQSGSPAINAGVGVGLVTDYLGHTVPNGANPEIGAYEYYPPLSAAVGAGAHTFTVGGGSLTATME